MEDVPSWLNVQFLSSVLRGAQVLRFSAASTAGPGVNYYSQLFRVSVFFKDTPQAEQEQFISLIIKAPFEHGFVADLNEADFYAKEPMVYKSLLSKMGEKINCSFGPKSFCCPRKNTLILEDLREMNYTMMDKFDQLDFTHCKILLESLAKFHATSVLCYNEDPELLKTVAEEVAYKKGGLSIVGSSQWAKTCMKRFANVVNEMDIRQSTKELVNSKVDNIWEIAVEISRPRTDSLNVLNHGDCWTNNILFKHASGEVVGVKFIDYQLVRFASPVLDLITFIYTSANREVREHRLQELYSVYLKSLNDSFETLGCEERFTPDDLRRSMKACSDWIIVVLSYDIPFFLSSSEDAISFHDSSMEEVEAKLNDTNHKRLHNSQYYRELLPSLLNMYEDVLYSEDNLK